MEKTLEPNYWGGKREGWAKLNKKGQKLFLVVAEQTLWACLSIIEKGRILITFPYLMGFFMTGQVLGLSQNKLMI